VDKRRNNGRTEAGTERTIVAGAETARGTDPETNETSSTDDDRKETDIETDRRQPDPTRQETAHLHQIGKTVATEANEIDTTSSGNRDGFPARRSSLVATTWEVGIQPHPRVKW